MKPNKNEDEYIWVQELQQRMAKLEAEQQAESRAEKHRLKETHWMHCPKCGQNLSTEKCGEVEIDVCPSCKGVWLDVGELGSIVEGQGQGSFFHRCLRILRVEKTRAHTIPPPLMPKSARFEFKYLIREPRAIAVADFVQTYLRASDHNGSGPIRGHPVISLYLDSPDFFFFRQADAGHKNRIKLRIRFYDNEWQRPAFLEIKRRDGEVICKDRAMITREEVRQILSNGWPIQPHSVDRAHLTHGKRQPDVNQDFWEIANRVRARGMIYVSYYREIYKSSLDEELHVTFDRQIRGSLFDRSCRLEVPTRGWSPLLPPYLDPFPKDGVILELKFDNRAPRWMLELVKVFNLNRIPVCKYSACIFAQQMHHGAPPLLEREQELVL